MTRTAGTAADIGTVPFRPWEAARAVSSKLSETVSLGDFLPSASNHYDVANRGGSISDGTNVFRSTKQDFPAECVGATLVINGDPSWSATISEVRSYTIATDGYSEVELDDTASATYADAAYSWGFDATEAIHKALGRGPLHYSNDFSSDNSDALQAGWSVDTESGELVADGAADYTYARFVVPDILEGDYFLVQGELVMTSGVLGVAASVGNMANLVTGNTYAATGFIYAITRATSNTGYIYFYANPSLTASIKNIRVYKIDKRFIDRSVLDLQGKTVWVEGEIHLRNRKSIRNGTIVTGAAAANIAMTGRRCALDDVTFRSAAAKAPVASAAAVLIGKTNGTQSSDSQQAVVRNCDFSSYRPLAIDLVANYGTAIKGCLFTDITLGIKERMSPNDAPYYTYALVIEDCEATSAGGTSTFIESEVGFVNVRGGVIQGFSTAVALGGSDTTLTTRNAIVVFSGVHFESNTKILENTTPTDQSSRQVFVRFEDSVFFGSQEIALGTRGRFKFARCYGTTSNVTLSGSAPCLLENVNRFLATGSTATGLYLRENTTYTEGDADFEFQNALNVNGSYGGGLAIIACSKTTGAGDASVSELFLVRFGRDSDAYSVASIARDEGTATDEFTFSIDDAGFLRVATSSGGQQRYGVVWDSRGGGG